ncbi:MAG: hypothetical protein H0V54_14115 [Chthoniobacterales bacterium]|nr:hypothetical protein [Chthoniobacterales bacterium]
MKQISLAALLVVSFLTGCASSSIHLVGPARPPLNPADVRIYRTPPLHYQEIALLDATSGGRFFHGSPEGEAEAIARLQVEAARVGANGVLITSLGDRANGTLGVGVGGGGISGGGRSVVAGGGAVSGAAPIVSNAATGIAIYVSEHR